MNAIYVTQTEDGEVFNVIPHIQIIKTSRNSVEIAYPQHSIFAYSDTKEEAQKTAATIAQHVADFYSEKEGQA